MLFAIALTSSLTNAYIFQWKLNVAYEDEGNWQIENQENIILRKNICKTSVASNNSIGRPCAY